MELLFELRIVVIQDSEDCKRTVLRVRMFLVVGIVCRLIRTQGYRNNNEDIYSTRTQTSQQAHARLVTTLDPRHSCINTASV